MNRFRVFGWVLFALGLCLVLALFVVRPWLRSKKQHLWALAASAIYFEARHCRHDTLLPRDKTEDNVRKERKILNEWWGIFNKETLLQNLELLESGGHRQYFHALVEAIQKDDRQVLNNYRDYLQDDEKFKERLAFVSRNRYKCGPKSLVAWDYCRYIMLCRLGYEVGYITEDEAWEKMMHAARILQKTFDSWKDMGNDFFFGREFWSLKYTREDFKYYRPAFCRLLRDPKSPWNTISWNLDLGTN